MMTSLVVFFIGLTFLGVIVFLRLYKHVLVTLLTLEFLGLMGFVWVYLGSYVSCYSELYVVAVYLSFLVCEGVLGLSLLVGMVRGLGSDSLGVSSSLVW